MNEEGSMDQLSVARPGRTAAMVPKTRAAVVFLAVAALLLVGRPAHALGWTTVPSPNEIPGDNLLYGADTSDASNVWAVGGVRPPRSTSHGLVVRYDGASWRSVPRTGLPGDETLRGVDVVSAADVWVAGHRPAGLGRYETVAAHWNGTAW